MALIAPMQAIAQKHLTFAQPLNRVYSKTDEYWKNIAQYANTVGCGQNRTFNISVIQFTCKNVEPPENSPYI